MTGAGRERGGYVGRALLGAALLLVAAAAGAEAQTVLPATIDRYGFLTVRVGPPGRPAGTWIVDLGAGTEVLSDSAAARLGRGPAGYFTAFRSTGERVDARRIRITPVALGPVSTPGDAEVWSGLDGLGLDGLVSARTFARTPVTLDFAGGRLVIETQASLAARVREGTVLPVETDRLRDVALDVFVDFDFGGGQRGRCELDTGSGSIDLNERYMAAFGLKKDSAGVTATRMPSGPDVIYRATLPTDMAPVGAPALRLAHPRVRFGNYIYDCIVGNTFWSTTTLTLDLPHRRVILGPRRP